MANNRHDNFQKKPLRSVKTRQIARNILKKQTGNNKIRNKWRELEIKWWGLEQWRALYRACVGRYYDR
jgi:hypothetical protein